MVKHRKCRALLLRRYLLQLAVVAAKVVEFQQPRLQLLFTGWSYLAKKHSRNTGITKERQKLVRVQSKEPKLLHYSLLSKY